MFQTIARPKDLAQEIAQAIKDEIRAGSYCVGDRLPTEAKLAAAFGVSRAMVREAVARLKSEGMVETVQGSGAFVRNRESACGLRIEPGAIMHAAALQPVFELRVELEALAAHLAAARRRRADLAAMRQALRQLADIVDRPAAHLDPDYTLHVAIARASGNRYIADMISHLTLQIRDSVAARRAGQPPTAGVLAQVHEEHDAIVAAIAARDAAAAEAVMRRHLRGAGARLGLAPDQLGRPG
jgi:DNA-binding FadR family transcriptional regulator